jgi:uncharacterized protein (TIGR02996 family)
MNMNINRIGYNARMYVNRGTQEKPLLVEVNMGSESDPVTDQQAILNAILANPDDLAPRNAYADWLDEHDQEERAWTIREGVPLRWYRRRYGQWVWTCECTHLMGDRCRPFWNNIFARDRGAWRTMAQAKTLFPKSWRRHLRAVVFRGGFVSELVVYRFHANVKRLLCEQPVMTITTTAEVLLDSILNYDCAASLRTIRLTSIPDHCTAARKRSCEIELQFAGVSHPIAIPATPDSIYTSGPVTTPGEVCYRLGLVFTHYLLPHGIIVQLPDSK